MKYFLFLYLCIFAQSTTVRAAPECPSLIGQYTCFNNKNPVNVKISMQKLRHATIYTLTDHQSTSQLAADDREYPFYGESGRTQGTATSYCKDNSLITRIIATREHNDSSTKNWKLLRRLDLDANNNLRWKVFGFLYENGETKVIDETFVCINSDNSETLN